MQTDYYHVSLYIGSLPNGINDFQGKISQFHCAKELKYLSYEPRVIGPIVPTSNTKLFIKPQKSIHDVVDLFGSNPNNNIEILNREILFSDDTPFV